MEMRGVRWNGEWGASPVGSYIEPFQAFHGCRWPYLGFHLPLTRSTFVCTLLKQVQRIEKGLKQKSAGRLKRFVGLYGS